MKKLKKFLVLLIIAFIVICFGVLVNGNYFNIEGILNLQSGNAMVGLANSSYPMLSHDKQHTGRTNVTGPQTNNTKWTFDLGEWIASTPAIGSDGTIYILASKNESFVDQIINTTVNTTTGGSNIWSTNVTNGTSDLASDSKYSNEYFLVALNPNGSLKWETNYTLNSPDGNAILIASDGTMYLSGTNILYAINPDGTIKWTYTPGDVATVSKPNIASDGTVYFTNGGKLYALSSNGTLKWETKSLDFSVSDTPAVGSDGTIYVSGGLDKGELYAFKQDGTLKWQHNFGRGDPPNPPSIGSDGTIYLTTDIFSLSGGYYLYAINSNGNEKWSFSSNSSEAYLNYVAPSIGPDGTIYTSVGTGTINGIVYAINPDGTVKWKFQTESQRPISSPIVIDSKGTIYFVSDQAYALYPNGTLKWQAYINNPGAKGYLAIGSDGTLYATSETSRYLYAIGP